MNLDFSHIETVHPVVARILRGKTPGERMRMALEANEFVRTMIRATLRSRHPEWSEGRVNEELIRRVARDGEAVWNAIKARTAPPT